MDAAVASKSLGYFGCFVTHWRMSFILVATTVLGSVLLHIAKSGFFKTNLFVCLGILLILPFTTKTEDYCNVPDGVRIFLPYILVVIPLILAAVVIAPKIQIKVDTPTGDGTEEKTEEKTEEETEEDTDVSG